MLMSPCFQWQLQTVHIETAKSVGASAKSFQRPPLPSCHDRMTSSFTGSAPAGRADFA
jgi:hypothetical protein